MYIVLIADNTTDKITRSTRIHWHDEDCCSGCAIAANANAVNPQQKQDTALLIPGGALSPNGLDLYFSAPLLSSYFLAYLFPLRCIIAPLLHERLNWTAKTKQDLQAVDQKASQCTRSRWFGAGGNALVGMFCTGLSKMRILSGWPFVRPSVGADSCCYYLVEPRVEVSIVVSGGSHNNSHVCVVFWCTLQLNEGRRLKKEETNYIAFLETAQGG